VFTVNYGNLGWVGLLVVKAEYRKKGISTLLTQKAIDYWCTAASKRSGWRLFPK
jgi:GNAT superfamily N-acetyltransferase